jgi:hypothetical protein
MVHSKTFVYLINNIDNLALLLAFSLTSVYNERWFFVGRTLLQSKRHETPKDEKLFLPLLPCTRRSTLFHNQMLS